MSGPINKRESDLSIGFQRIDPNHIFTAGVRRTLTRRNDSSNHSCHETAADPAFGFSLEDVLHSTSTDDGSDSSPFTGIGGLDIGFASHIYLGSSSSSDSSHAQVTDSDSGGLLGRLL